jgi:hypothetical protein
MSVRIRRPAVALAIALAFGAAGSAAAQTAPSFATRVQLGNAALAATEGSRMVLQYLASCALSPATVLEANVDGKRREWPGSIGVAPEWHRRALSEDEERWVSACMLARTNYFGVPVLLALRAAFPNSAPGLQVSAEEARAYPFEEATFFGNLFGADRPAYVCGDNDSAERKVQLGAHRRICALPIDQRLDDGRRLTACGFIYVGKCSEANFTQGGVRYRQAVTVSLPAVPDANMPP